MPSTLLSLCQDLCRKQGITIPTTIITNTDEQYQQMFALVVEEAHELGQRLNWQPRIRRKGNFNHAGGVTGPSYSAMQIDPETSPFIRKILANTVWDETNKRPVRSIQSWEHWQAYISNATTQGPDYVYYLMARWLCIAPIPSPVASVDFSFMFVSGAHWRNSADTADVYEPTTDNDILILPSPLVKAGLKWRWKAAKGLPYAEDFRSYELQISQWGSGEQAQEPISMDGTPPHFQPGIYVPTWTNIGQ